MRKLSGACLILLLSATAAFAQPPRPYDQPAKESRFVDRYAHVLNWFCYRPQEYGVGKPMFCSVRQPPLFAYFLHPGCYEGHCARGFPGCTKGKCGPFGGACATGHKMFAPPTGQACGFLGK